MQRLRIRNKTDKQDSKRLKEIVNHPFRFLEEQLLKTVRKFTNPGFTYSDIILCILFKFSNLY